MQARTRDLAGAKIGELEDCPYCRGFLALSEAPRTRVKRLQASLEGLVSKARSVSFSMCVASNSLFL